MPICSCLAGCCKKKKVRDYEISFHKEKIPGDASINEAYEDDSSGVSQKAEKLAVRKERYLWKTVLQELQTKYGELRSPEDDNSDGSMAWVFKVLKPVRISPLSEKRDHIYLTVLQIMQRNTRSKEESPNLESVADDDESVDHAGNMTNTVPSIGKPAPCFKGTAVVDGEFKEISLSDYKNKYLVIFFYPLDFTFVCPTEIIAFSERAEEFRKINCELIAVSTDSHFSHLAWINTSRKEGGLGQMNIPLLADKSMEISKKFGVLKEDDGVAFRGLFIVDGKQNLRQITINDLPVGRDVDETLRLVQAFQFTDTHGEVCPAGWKPGSKTMKADPKGSKAYFSSQN